MSTAEVAKRYFGALAARDVQSAVACWLPGGVDRFVGQRELVAPEGVRAYFTELFAAFPDLALQILETTTSRERAAVRWRAQGTFAGPGRFEGLDPNRARLDIEGCDVVTVRDGLIVANQAYLDRGDLARQLGLLPAAGSTAERRLIALANLRARVTRRLSGEEPERIADGVWLVRGGFPTRSMNVYLLADANGVTVFDAGIEAMTGAVAAAAARLGGVRRIVLGHADADHRGAAPGLHAPVYCHPAEREASESDSPFRAYWDLGRLAPYARPVYPRLLRAWDGGAVTIEGTLGEGDQVAGFEVIELSGHAPGLIGLFRRSDRLALVSDCFYTIDPQTGRHGPPAVPHPAFNLDTEQARASIRKLAALEPRAAWPGHAEPVRGDVAGTLAGAADA